MFIFDYCFPVEDHLVTLYGDHLTGILIHKVLQLMAEYLPSSCGRQLLDVDL
jgi:hypothetical protein